MVFLKRLPWLRNLGVFVIGTSFIVAQESPPPATDPDIKTLEAFNRRVLDLRAQEKDPRSAAQLENVHKLLKLMQQSIAQERKKKVPPPDEEPPPEQKNEPEDPPADEPAAPEVPKAIEPAPPITHDPEPFSPLPVPPPPVAESPRLEPTPEEKPLLNPAPQWFHEISLISAAGYESNVLHSAINEINSATLLVDLSAHIVNTRRHDQRMLAMGRYSRIHFLDENNIRDEDLLFLFAQYEHRLNSSLWAGGTIDYLNAHLPVDRLDFIDPDRSFAPIGLTQWAVAAQLAWEPSDEHQVILRTGLRREEVDLIPGMDDNDADQYFIETAYHWSPTKSQRISVRYECLQRDYESREQRENDGTRIPGSYSSVKVHQLRLSHRWQWEMGAAKARWTQAARVRLDDDNGPGYDDLLRLDLQTRFEWHYKNIELVAALQGGIYDYESRQVSSMDDRLRERRFWEASLEASYALSKRSSLWMRYHYRDNDGNRSTDQYTDQGIYAGFKFTF